MVIEPRDSRAPRAADAAAPVGLDVATFDAFFENQHERVYAFIARRIEARSTAEELTTVVFERVVEAARSGSMDSDDLGAFALRVAASAVVDHTRRARRPTPAGVRASDLDRGDDAAESEAISEEAATRVFAIAINGDLLRRAMLALPEDQQRAILLAYLDDLAPHEIGALLGCSVPEVSLRVNRALRALRATMTKAAIDAA